ncbi:hypothetical protein CT0861_04707, partial [Colletotrichum tofieldiae]
LQNQAQPKASQPGLSVIRQSSAPGPVSTGEQAAGIPPSQDFRKNLGQVLEDGPISGALDSCLPSGSTSPLARCPRRDSHTGRRTLGELANRRQLSSSLWRKPSSAAAPLTGDERPRRTIRQQSSRCNQRPGPLDQEEEGDQHISYTNVKKTGELSRSFFFSPVSLRLRTTSTDSLLVINQFSGAVTLLESPSDFISICPALWAYPSSSARREKARRHLSPNFETGIWKKEQQGQDSVYVFQVTGGQRSRRGRKKDPSGLGADDYGTGRPDELDKGLREAFLGLIPCCEKIDYCSHTRSSGLAESCIAAPRGPKKETRRRAS